MDAVAEKQVRSWIADVLGAPFPNETIHNALKDGVILAEVINKITRAVSPKFPQKSKISFAQMENICYFIEQARKLGVPDSENFQTIDLYEGKNMKQVGVCIYSLSRNLHKKGITEFPIIGPKLVEQVKITFTEEQLNDAKRAVSWQYGQPRESITRHNGLN